MISEEAIRLRIRNNIVIPIVKKSRNRKLKIKKFTILSNNCWGGTIYESLDLPKLSPTVGMFIMPDDYILFLKNLDFYLNQTLEIIHPNDSKWKNVLQSKTNWGTYLIGKLADIELHMLHHHDEKIALEKWYRRIERIDYQNLIVKFNDQNGCTLEHINEFLNLPYNNKICFVSRKLEIEGNDLYYIKQPRRYIENGIQASREPIFKIGNISLIDYINQFEHD